MATEERGLRRSAWAFLLVWCSFVFSTATAQNPRPTPKKSPSASDSNGGTEKSEQSTVREGIKVEFSIQTLSPAEKGSVMAGEDAVVRFRISDTATSTPLSGVRPAAWMRRREKLEVVDTEKCKEQIQSFVQGSLRARPDVDLNSYYLLALNNEPNISVIDPLLGFGGSKLFTLVGLENPGEDWALTKDRARLFVSMPASGKVAVVDTISWKVVAQLETGGRPARLALQPDEKYLWVGLDGPGSQPGIAAIDTAQLKIVARIATGSGKHEIAISGDNRFAFVTNPEDGTLSVVEIGKLATVRDVKIGGPTSALGISPLSQAVYVANGADGSIAVIDGARHQIVTRVAATAGLNSIRFAPGGRWGFATNPAKSVVHIFDSSTNRIVHTAEVGKQPDRVTFTRAFAYVRSSGTEEVSSIRLQTIGGELDIVKFPGGQLAPNAAPAFASRADSIVPAPEGGSVLVANPADRMIYYYSEGMAAPMGNFQNYRRTPRAVIVVDRSLRETAPGVYTTNVRLPKSGTYTVPFLLDSPRILHCFEADAKPNPAIKEEHTTALRIEYVRNEQPLRVGQPYKLRFKLYDTASGRTAENVNDVRVLVFLSPGIWQHRELARVAGAGEYEFTFEAPQTGVYMVFVESPSKGVAFRQLPHLTLQAEAAQGKSN